MWRVRLSKWLFPLLRHDLTQKNYSYAKQIISDLLQNKIDMSQLVITKALAKAGEHDIT